VRGAVERDDYVYLRREALGLRLRPVNNPGRFRLDDLQVTPVSGLSVAFFALRQKLAALRRYGLLKRALTNGLGLLLRGRLDEFLGKLHDGLHWPQTSERVLHRVTPSPLHPVTPSSGHPVI